MIILYTSYTIHYTSSSRLILLTSFLLILYHTAQSQCPTAAQFGTNWRDGSFEITGREAGTQCTGRAVSLVTSAGIINARYIYNYRTRADTANATTNTSFVYTQPGFYYIVQLGTRNGQPSVVCNAVQVYATSKPVFSLVEECGGTAKLTFNNTGQRYSEYVVNWGDGKPTQTYPAAPAVVSYTYQVPGAYQVVVTGQGTNALVGCNATSDPLPFVVSPVPAAVATATATVVGGQYAQVSVSLPAGNTARNFVFTQIDGRERVQPTSVFTDSLAGVAQALVCYQVSYRNACNQSPATKPTVCTVYLADSSGVLQWSTASPFVGRVTEYIVEALDANGQVVQQFRVGLKTQWDTDANEGSVASYRVRAVGANGGVSMSNAVAALQRGAALYVPNVFSPNGDQFNDVLEMKGRRILKGAVTIYDRWGSVVFFTSDWRNGWDGNDAKGQPLAVGMFTYKVNYEDTKNQAHQKLGIVQLVR